MFIRNIFNIGMCDDTLKIKREMLLLLLRLAACLFNAGYVEFPEVFLIIKRCLRTVEGCASREFVLEMMKIGANV